MPQQIQCSSCKTQLQCQDAMIAQMQAGQRFQCPVCKTPLALPAVAVPEPVPVPVVAPAPPAVDVTQTRPRTGTVLFHERAQLAAKPAPTAAPPKAPAPRPAAPAPAAPVPAKPRVQAAPAKPQPQQKTGAKPSAVARAVTPATKSTAPAAKPQAKPVQTPPPAKALTQRKTVQATTASPVQPLPSTVVQATAGTASPPRSRSGLRKVAFLLIGSFLVVLLCASVTAAVLIPMLLWKPTPPPVTVIDYGKFGVIEIGTKGIKSFVIHMYKNESQETDFEFNQQNIPDNIDTGKLVVKGNVDQQHLNKIAAKVHSTIETMRADHKVPDNKIYIVFSSGFSEQFKQDKKQEKDVKDQLTEGLITALEWPEEQRKHVESVDKRREAWLGSEFVIPTSKRKSGLHLDIGSGNLKGGYFDANNRFQEFSTESESYLGTAEFAKEIAANLKNRSYPDAAADHGLKLKVRMAQMLKNNSELEERDPVYLNGGIAWVMMFCTHPERGDQKDDRRIPVEPKDIAQFSQMVLDARVELNDAGMQPEDKAKKESTQSWKKLREAVLKNPKLEGASAEHMEWLNQQLAKPIFSNNELIAGSQILSALDSALEFKNKKLYFYRDGHLAWSLGYLNAKVQGDDKK